MSVHWDRLDVKVAVKYPKSYGRHGAKGHDAALEAKGGADEDEVRLTLSFRGRPLRYPLSLYSSYISMCLSISPALSGWCVLFVLSFA